MRCDDQSKDKEKYSLFAARFDGFLLVATSTPLEALFSHLVAACMCSSYAVHMLALNSPTPAPCSHMCYIHTVTIIRRSTPSHYPGFSWVSDATWVVNCS